MQRPITFLYDDAQVAEISAQLPTNISTCKTKISEVQAQISQYDDLIKQMELKIEKADRLISDRADRSEVAEQMVPLSVNCQTSTGRRSSNEDEELAQIIRIDGKPRYQFLGVFDGHGGCDAAQFCRHNLLRVLMETKFLGYGQLTLALQEALIAADQQFCDVENQKGQVGSTAACLIIDLLTKKAAIANSGDARVVVSLKGGVVLETSDHKPSLEAERQRLKDNFNTDVMEFNGVQRVNGTLAVSRAIGDLDFKIYGVLALPQGYTEVKSEDIQFVIVACDGLWDMLTTTEAVGAVKCCLGYTQPQTDIEKAVVQYYSGSILEGDTILSGVTEEKEVEQFAVTKKDTAGKLAQSLARAAFIKGSQDNITVIVALRE